MSSKVTGVIERINIGDNNQRAIVPSAYGYCETAAATAAKIVDMTGFKLYTGVTIFVKFKERNNAANPTLNVNGTGAKNIYRYGTTRPSTTDTTSGWPAGAVLAFTYDGSGWQEHYWYNNQYTLSNQHQSNGNFTADSAIYQCQLLFHMDEDTLSPLNNADNNTGTSKTMLTTMEFDPFLPIYYYDSTTTVVANGNVAASSCHFQQGGCDLRYSFNCGDSSLTNMKNVYLKCSKQSNGKFRIASAAPLTQTLPSAADGYYYILLGRAYSGYLIGLYADKPIFYHDGTALRVYTDPAKAVPFAALTGNPTDNSALNAALAGKAAASHNHDSAYAAKSHTHDDRYYTESEIDTKLAGKANGSHAHGNITSAGAISSDTAAANGDKLILADASASSKLIRSGIAFDGSTTTKGLTPKGTWESFASSNHVHDDRYYTESEMDTKLASKANSTHTHDDCYYTENETDTLLANKADSDHDHDDVYLGIHGTADAAKSTLAIQLKTEDLNDILPDNTTWYFAAGGNTVVNKPVNANAFGMVCFRDASGYRTQILQVAGTNSIYIRHKTGSTYGAWDQIMITDTTYTGENGITVSGTKISNAGVRSIATGSANGTISVNTNGTAANVPVKGLGTAAYTESTAYAAKTHNHDSAYAAKSHTHEVETVSVGSASAGTAIAADDITAWSAGTLPSISVSNGVIKLGKGSVPALSYTARSIPNISVMSKTVVTGIS